MKLLKYAGYALGGIVVLAILGLAAVAAWVDGAFVKSRLERYMLEQKHRTLSIKGEPKLRLFPVAGLSLGPTTLSEPDSSDSFVTFDSAELALRLLPLLAGDLVIETVSAKGLHVTVRERRDGHMNFEDLEKRDTHEERDRTAPRERGALPNVVIRELNIDHARLSYVNEITGQELNVEDLGLKLGPLADTTPSPLTFTANLSGRRPEVGIKAQASGLVKIDLVQRSLALQRFDARLNGNAAAARGMDVRLSGDVLLDGRKEQLDVNGVQLYANATLDRDALRATLSAPRISVTRERATGSAVSGALKIAGPERKLDAKLDIAAAEGSFSSFLLPKVALVIEAAADGGHVNASISTPVQANLSAGTWELPKLVADLSVHHPKLPQKSFRLPLEASLRGDQRKHTLAARAAANAEDFDFRLQFDAKRVQPLEASFDFSSQRLNLDRYPVIAVGSGARKSDDRVDLSGLLGPALRGRIRIGSLQANGVKLTDVAADLRLASGTLELSPHSARLYGGTLSGALSANARANQVSAKENVQGVQVGPLMRDLAKRDILEGRGDVLIDVSGSGRTMSALKRSLAGSARMVLKDGAYKGIDLADIFRRAQAAVGARSAAQSSNSSQKTEFSELSASFAIKGGVAHNEDLVLKSPLVQVSGAGNFDIAASTLDYLLKPALAPGAARAQGRDLGDIIVPVHVHGPLDALRYDIDYSALASRQLRERLSEKLNEQLGGAKPPAGQPASPQDQLRDQLRERLRGLLGR